MTQFFYRINSETERISFACYDCYTKHNLPMFGNAYVNCKCGLTWFIDVETNMVSAYRYNEGIRIEQ